MLKFEIVNSRTVRDQEGRDHDVLESIDALPWVSQLCPQMPHDYAHKLKSDPLAYAVVERMLKASNPDSYRAYFRGYQSPNRYREAPDGRRYWLTNMMINRCWPIASRHSVGWIRVPRPSRTGMAHRGRPTVSACTSATPS